MSSLFNLKLAPIHPRTKFFSSGKKRAASLMVVTVQATDIPPKETVVYTKQTQTTQAGTDHVRDGKKILLNFINVLIFVSFTFNLTNYGVFTI